MNIPAVSICCITYNHEKYIRDALEGFLMQKTNFPFEVLIHDDASTDHTADIIREYEAKYPDIIKPIYQTENQYSQGVNIIEIVLSHCKGRYIAICEGDDFWTDPEKLQLQFDFLESHPDYSFSVHERYVLNHIKKEYCHQQPIRYPEEQTVFISHYLSGLLGTPAQTVFYRRSIFDQFAYEYYKSCQGAPMGDLQLMVFLRMYGKCHCIPRYMATYRIAPGSAMHYNDSALALAFRRKAYEYTVRLAEQIGHPEWCYLQKPDQRTMENPQAVQACPRKSIIRSLKFRNKILIARVKYKIYMLTHWKNFI